MMTLLNVLMLFFIHIPHAEGNETRRLTKDHQADPVVPPQEFVKAFPAADYGRMSIQLGQGMEPQDSLTIRNVDGKSIFKMKGSQQIKNKITIDVTGWPNSVYHVFYYHDEHIYVGKMVKM